MGLSKEQLDRLREIVKESEKYGSCRLSEEVRDHCIEAANDVLKKQQPLPGDICRNKKCDGRVTRRAFSLSSSGVSFSPPRCEKCGLKHIDSKEGVSKVGVQELYDFFDNWQATI